MTPFGFTEELALERLAVAEHERRAAELWRARRYAESRMQTAYAELARQRVEALEDVERREGKEA